jgi:hypothetical protein
MLEKLMHRILALAGYGLIKNRSEKVFLTCFYVSKFRFFIREVFYR